MCPKPHRFFLAAFGIGFSVGTFGQSQTCVSTLWDEESPDAPETHGVMFIQLQASLRRRARVRAQSLEGPERKAEKEDLPEVGDGSDSERKQLERGEGTEYQDNRYGPDGCVSIYKVNETCIVRTRCAGVDVSNYEFGFICEGERGSRVRHLFGRHSFAPEETFDTLIPCDKCLRLDSGPQAEIRATHSGAARREMTMADLYQEAERTTNMASTMTDLYQGNQNIASAPRTMADYYQRAFGPASSPAALGDSAWRATTPTALRQSMWLAFIVLSLLGVAVQLQSLALGELRPVLPPSRLPGACVDVELDLVPSGTVCAVCLGAAAEDSGGSCDAQNGLAVDNEPRPPQLELKAVASMATVVKGRWCRTPCGHCFHRDCLETWLAAGAAAKGQLRQRCPLCNWS